ncbi:sigma-70 family RNA polymerase sigma factor [Nonomuraea soli]|uniref:RNA polymerase sigma factor (Sigma-70 family) n=1 Tax=Nonomuraea soli TaxID=1032476 RepID=A0A7W0CTL4_9ACTN|nr:sigma-70 family RNA polymerase sigma factor [Nonomuraea soli]MBA2897124.1 RNA polymerase sigma factor (sigma-70 family) [Nonomuraea soli]
MTPFSEFVAARGTSLLRLAYLSCGSADDAEDVLRIVPTGTLPDHPAPPSSGVELRQILVDGLRRLPARQRAVLVLRYWEDLTETQTAAVMGCSVGTVKSQSSKALARLRVLIGDELVEGVTADA